MSTGVPRSLGSDPGAITALALSSLVHRGDTHTESLASQLTGKYILIGFKLYCDTVFFSGVPMPVIDCDSQEKKMVAEAGYMCIVAEQQRGTSPLLDRKVRGRSPYPSIGYLLPLAVRMVALASR